MIGQKYKQLQERLKNMTKDELVELFLNTDLELQTLKKQFKKKLVEKFKIGQEVFCIYENMIFKGIVTCVEDNFVWVKCIDDTFNKSVLSHYTTNNSVAFYEDYLFSTRKEAMQKLQELKNSKRADENIKVGDIYMDKKTKRLYKVEDVGYLLSSKVKKNMLLGELVVDLTDVETNEKFRAYKKVLDKVFDKVEK